MTKINEKEAGTGLYFLKMFEKTRNKSKIGEEPMS